MLLHDGRRHAVFTKARGARATARLRRVTHGNGVVIDYDRVIGATLRFSKREPETAGGRPRWKIDRPLFAVDAVQVTPVQINGKNIDPRNNMPLPHTPSKADMHMDSVPAPTDKRQKREDIHAAYESALVAALAIQKKIFKGKLAPKLSAESVAASAATMFIQYERNRCL